MLSRAWGEEFRTTTVCIDSYEDGVLSGRFYNPYLSDGRKFKSLTQFLLEMERSMDSMDFPKACTETRTFAPPVEGGEREDMPEFLMGNKANFAVKILFRQNASWQGTVTWMEGRQEKSFRSALELIFLIDNALSYSKAS